MIHTNIIFASMQQQNQAPSGWGSSNKTLADYVKESAWQNSFATGGSSTGGSSSNNNSVIGGASSFSASVIGTNNHHSALTNNHHNATTSMPWAAAVKLPPDHHHQHHHHHQLNQQQQHNNVASAAAVAAAAAAIKANSFDYNGGSIGSWSSPETSSSNRGGWNADGSSKGGDGILDDGTAIWGNPSTKKTGVDWAEKEVEIIKKSSSSSSNQAALINSEKRIQKPEPTISSLNGTEAWGAPLRQQSLANNTQPSLVKINNDNSGNNNFGTSATKGSEWGEPTLTSSSLQQNNTISNELNSSPPNNDCSVWNNLGISKQKSSDWLSSPSGIGGSSANSISAGSRLDDLNKRLESTNLFDSSSTSSSSSSSTTAAAATTSLSSSMTKNASNSTGSNNPNLEHHQSHNTIGLSLGNGSAIGNGCNGGNGSVGNGINDLRQQMSANFSNDLLDSPNRHQRQQGVGGNSSSNNNQQQSQQLDHSSVAAAAEAAAAGAPSRDLLKQMVHQIQLAVQAGHLNAHILNQPMSTPTLQLVYQLLQQIKTLHQLQEIQQRAGLRPDIAGPPSNMDIQINRIRQHITLLQKAITQQQAALTKNNENIGEFNKQQQANNYSYATISKLSTNLKVPSNNNMSNIISNSNSNMDSFRRSSLIDTLSNSNSDPLRSAQATFDANATIDKTLSSLIQQASSSAVAKNILSSNKTTSNQSGDSFSKTSPDFDQQTNNKNVGLFSAQSSSSSSSSAWSAFSSGGSFVSQQAWPSQLRISSNVSQDHNQYSAFDMVPDFGPGKTWRGSSILSDDKDNSNTNNTSNMAPGSNINLATSPNNSASNANNNNNNALKQQQQMKRNNILGNRDSSLFCDWSNNSDSGKGNFDQISNTGSTFSSSAIGGLSLQSNPWMFAPTSSSLNIGSGIDRIISKNTSCGDNFNTSNKIDNGNTDKMAGDSSLFLKNSSSSSSSNSGNIQRSSSAFYDWSDLASTGLQYNVDNVHINKQQQGSSTASNAIGGGRPAPPPGLLSNFGTLIASSPTGASSLASNGISLLDHSNKLLGNSNESESIQLQSRESAGNLWSGTWFD